MWPQWTPITNNIEKQVFLGNQLMDAQDRELEWLETNYLRCVILDNHCNEPNPHSWAKSSPGKHKDKKSNSKSLPPSKQQGSWDVKPGAQTLNILTNSSGHYTKQISLRYEVTSSLVFCATSNPNISPKHLCRAKWLCYQRWKYAHKLIPLLGRCWIFAEEFWTLLK